MVVPSGSLEDDGPRFFLPFSLILRATTSRDRGFAAGGPPRRAERLLGDFIGGNRHNGRIYVACGRFLRCASIGRMTERSRATIWEWVVLVPLDPCR